MSTKEDLKRLLPFCSEAINKKRQEEFLATLTDRIRNTVKAHSTLRRVTEERVLDLGEQAEYPIKAKSNIHILPKIGEVPLCFMETIDDVMFVPTFRIATALDWAPRYVTGNRLDVIEKAIKEAVNKLIGYEEESLFRLLTPAATNIFKQKDKEYYSFSIDIIKSLADNLEEQGKTLTHVLASPQDVKELKAELGIDEDKDLPTIELEFANKTLQVKVIEVKDLGVTGRYNINGSLTREVKSEKGSCDNCDNCTSTNAVPSIRGGIFGFNASGNLNSYKAKNPNIVDEDLKLIKLGESQVYGIDADAKSLVMPIREKLTFYEDPQLHKKQLIGYYGWEEIGLAILDNKAVTMEVVDRSKQ
jgi:hypothetical protein